VHRRGRGAFAGVAPDLTAGCDTRPVRLRSFRPDPALLLIGVAAFAIRVVYTIALGQHAELGLTDGSFYSISANLLADGEGYVDLFRSFEEGRMLRTAHHPPGWPALLAAFSMAGVETQFGHRLVGCLVGALVVLGVGALGRRVGGRRVGVLAAGLAAVHPTLVAADGSLMAETLAGLGVLLVLVLAFRVADRPTAGRALVLGLAIGCTALVRGEALLYGVLVVGPVAAVAARRSVASATRPFLRVSGVALAGIALVVVPWSIRNTLLFDDFVLISVNDSTVLAGANCDAAFHGPGTGAWHFSCVSRPAGRLDEAAEARVFRERGLDYLRSNADRLPAVVTARLRRTWGVWSLRATAEGRHRGTQEAGNVVWIALLLPGGAAGAYVLARQRRRVDLALLGAPVAAATIVTVVGFGMVRFRHPMELVAVVLSAVAAGAVADHLGRRQQEPTPTELHDHA
jgi:4-amino-4-deoxy-L-arabinose transferase-like glycosyltransferase